ncbi:hypothetical protein B0T26DRAFT_679368 [Lasiosphaeria miniovina]|uniref:Uncharacterized protein n=1 Tax=Lasiosphaeria miniovina TaxID=1954250 RepID=A0AA40A6G6_9PEZI|nr:uncharacterized protein B0T26DRAFT_679368 [Lasiosphaeria miniovina]KAK0710038.1 hypothetical protein B0T26DRAFT_679368 [Lasiosphaeria miniovina]
MPIFQAVMSGETQEYYNYRIWPAYGRRKTYIYTHHCSLSRKHIDAMDPITILGVTSGIISFIGFTQQVFALALSIHGKGTDAQFDYKTVDEVTAKAKDLAEGTQRNPARDSLSDRRAVEVLGRR